MNKGDSVSGAFGLDLTKILNYLVKNEEYMAKFGDITFRYIGTKEDTARDKREIFEIERLVQ